MIDLVVARLSDSPEMQGVDVSRVVGEMKNIYGQGSTVLYSRSHARQLMEVFGKSCGHAAVTQKMKSDSECADISVEDKQE